MQRKYIHNYENIALHTIIFFFFCCGGAGALPFLNFGQILHL